MSDWWARALGQPAGRPAPSPQGAPAREQYAPPFTGVGQPGGPGGAFDPANPASSAAQWQGGRGTRTETTRCPNCGGDYYFSNRNVNPLAGAGGGAGPQLMTQSGAVSVAPRCFSCGFTTAHPQQTGSM